ncbi:hypothetical protein GCM10017687_79590 [Streptomyces echinatus]
MSTQSIAQPLQGRVAVITGASSGIGEASAEKLAALGAHAVVLARRADRLTDLVARIKKNGGSATAITADVTDRAAIQAAADQVAAERGGADLLLNNAGVMLPAPIEELATDQWQRQIDLNITGLMNVIGAFVPQLVKAAGEGGGVADLINTSSIAARTSSRTSRSTPAPRRTSPISPATCAWNWARRTSASRPSSQASSVPSYRGTSPTRGRSTGWRAPRRPSSG